MSAQTYTVTFKIGRKVAAFDVTAESERQATETAYERACRLRGTRGYQGAHIRLASVEIADEGGSDE